MSHAAPTPVPQVDAPRRRPSSWLEAKRKPTAKQHLRALRRSQEKRERELDVPQCVAGHQHLFPRSPALGVNSNVNNSLAQSQHIFSPSRILEFLSMMRLSSYLTYVSGGTQEARRIVKLSGYSLRRIKTVCLCRLKAPRAHSTILSGPYKV